MHRQTSPRAKEQAGDHGTEAKEERELQYRLIIHQEYCGQYEDAYVELQAIYRYDTAYGEEIQ